MKLQIYYKDNGLADVEINEEIVASNIKNPETFVRRYLEMSLL